MGHFLLQGKKLGVGSFDAQQKPSCQVLGKLLSESLSPQGKLFVDQQLTVDHPLERAGLAVDGKATANPLHYGLSS